MIKKTYRYNPLDKWKWFITIDLINWTGADPPPDLSVVYTVQDCTLEYMFASPWSATVRYGETAD